MKRLVSILLLVFAVTIGFAQSSTPDYIQKAKVGLNQYYPQFKDYFEPIFVEYNKLGANTHNIFNSKIYDNFDTFKEDLTTERDKCATILTAIDELLGDKKFKNSKKQVDSPEGEEPINWIANEILIDVSLQISREYKEAVRENEEARRKNEEARRENEKARRENEKARRENEKARRENAEVKSRVEKLTVILDNIKKGNEYKDQTPEGIVKTIESHLEAFDINLMKELPVMQNMIKGYIDLNKQINRRPSPLGQKFIDEYNRITKSK